MPNPRQYNSLEDTGSRPVNISISKVSGTECLKMGLKVEDENFQKTRPNFYKFVWDIVEV